MFSHLSPRLLDLSGPDSPAGASLVQAASVPEQILFPIVLAIIAATYAAVGQAGGTGYIAVM